MTNTTMEPTHTDGDPAQPMVPDEFAGADLFHLLDNVVVADEGEQRERFAQIAALVAKVDHEMAGDLIPVGLAPDVRALRGVRL